MNNKTSLSNNKFCNKVLKYPAFKSFTKVNSEIGYYELPQKIINLQNSVNFSRYRENNIKELHHNVSLKDIEHINDFLSATNSVDAIAEQFYKFQYPNDYQWLSKEWKILNYSDPWGFNGISTGYAGCDIDFEDINLIKEDNKEIEIYATEIENEIEIEVNFNTILEKLRRDISHYGRIDIGLRIPYSLKERVKEYEIRLIKFLTELNVEPRININLFKPEMEPEHRTTFFLTYIQFVKY